MSLVLVLYLGLFVLSSVGFVADDPRAAGSGRAAPASLSHIDEAWGAGLLLALHVPGYLSGPLLVATGGMGT